MKIVKGVKRTHIDADEKLDKALNKTNYRKNI